MIFIISLKGRPIAVSAGAATTMMARRRRAEQARIGAEKRNSRPPAVPRQNTGLGGGRPSPSGKTLCSDKGFLIYKPGQLFYFFR